MLSANPKAAALPVMALAVAAVQLGAAFLAISVQQSTGARLDRFLDGLVVLTILWTIVVLFELFAFHDKQTKLVAGPAIALTGIAAVLIVIFRAAEGVMGHSQGFRYALGNLGYLCSLIWAGASLWFLVAQRYRDNQANADVTADQEAPQPVDKDHAAPSSIENDPVVLEPESARAHAAVPSTPQGQAVEAPAAEIVAPSTPPRRSAFSAALEDPPTDP